MNTAKTTLIEKGILLSNILIAFGLFTDIFIRENAVSTLTVLCVVSLLIFIAFAVTEKLSVFHLVVVFVVVFTFAAFAAHPMPYICMKRWMMFVAFLLYAVVCVQIRVSAKTLKRLTVINSVQALLLLLFAFLPASYSMGILEYCYNRNSSSLRLMYLFLTSVVAEMTFRKYLPKFARILWSILNVGLCVCIYRAGSRGTLIALIVFLAVSVLYRRAKYDSSVKVSNIIIAICILFPLVFVLVYYQLVKDVPNFDIKLFGYTISTRNNMWFSVIDDFKSNWFWGDYYHHQGMLHNGYLDMINAYGYPITGIFMWLMYRCIQKINRGGWVNVVIVAGLLALILETTGEAASFMGDYRGIMIANLFLFRTVPDGPPLDNREAAT